MHDAVAPLRSAGVSLSGILVPALAMTGACLAVVAVASTVERGSPWAGINSIATGIGLSGSRPPRRFTPLASLAGIGTAIGGSVLLAGIHGLVSKRIQRRIGGIGGTVLGALFVSVTAVALDALFMRNAIFPAFANALGVRGTVAKYGAMGAAAALSSR